MLRHLPEITQESIESFSEKELVDIAARADELLSQLDEVNPRLAKAIKVAAEVVADNITEGRDVLAELGQSIEAECRVAILLILRLISRALEAEELEKLTKTKEVIT